MARFSPSSIKRNAAVWMRQGISPSRLALTLALGFAIGCIPVIGIPTVLCAGLALMLRLNQPAIQAANYAAMPLQLFLIVPFVRLGGWLFGFGPHPALAADGLMHNSPMNHLITQAGGMAGHALIAWMIVAGPAIALMTLTFTLMLRRIPALAATETSD